MAWATIGQVVLYGTHGVFRVRTSGASSVCWVYDLEPLEKPAGILVGVPAWQCRVLPVQPELPAVPTPEPEPIPAAAPRKRSKR